MKKLRTECESKCSLPHESWDSGNSGGNGWDSSVASLGQSWESWGSVGDGSLGSKVVSSGGLHGGLVHGDHGAVGEGLESEESLRGGSSNTGGENLVVNK